MFDFHAPNPRIPFAPGDLVRLKKGRGAPLKVRGVRAYGKRTYLEVERTPGGGAIYRNAEDFTFYVKPTMTITVEFSL